MTKHTGSTVTIGDGQDCYAGTIITLHQEKPTLRQKVTRQLRGMGIHDQQREVIESDQLCTLTIADPRWYDRWV